MSISLLTAQGYRRGGHHRERRRRSDHYGPGASAQGVWAVTGTLSPEEVHR